MFGTPTSTVSSLLEIMRSPPSVASHSRQKNSDNFGMNAASSSILRRPSKSSASVGSFNSSSRYQPSSCSTYSASAPAANGSAPDIFKRQYVTQAMRLVDDALMEQDKGSCCDESFALDCYLASLEYLLSAVSTNNNLHREIGSVDRQAIIHAKLINLIRRTEEFSPSSHEQDGTSGSTETATGWWNGVWGRIDPSRNNIQEAGDVLFSTPSELAAQCDCGRKVLVKIPEYLLPDSFPDHQPAEVPKTAHVSFFAAWYGWALGLVFSMISMINGFILPSLITFFIRTTVAVVVYLEKRFDVVNLLLNFFVNTIKLLLKISQDYNFNKQIGDFFSWLISKLVKIALAFVKSDDMQNLNILFDLNDIQKNDQHQAIAKNPVDSDTTIRMNSFQGAHQSNNQFTGVRGSSSSRFSMKSDSTCQLNRKDYKSPNFFSHQSPNLPYRRSTSKYNF